MPVIFVGLGVGSEYAAIVTDVRPEGVCLTVFAPGGGLQSVTRVPFASSKSDLRPTLAPPYCYFVQPPRDGYSAPEPSVT